MLVWFGLGCVALVCGLGWFGLVWFGLVWFGLVWFGLVWFGLVWFVLRAQCARRQPRAAGPTKRVSRAAQVRGRAALARLRLRPATHGRRGAPPSPRASSSLARRVALRDARPLSGGRGVTSAHRTMTRRRRAERRACGTQKGLFITDVVAAVCFMFVFRARRALSSLLRAAACSPLPPSLSPSLESYKLAMANLGRNHLVAFLGVFLAAFLDGYFLVVVRTVGSARVTLSLAQPPYRASSAPVPPRAPRAPSATVPRSGSRTVRS